MKFKAVYFSVLDIQEVAATASFLTLTARAAEDALTHTELLSLDSSFDTRVRTVSQYAPLVEAVYDGFTRDEERYPDGVWLYDVVSVFGEWLVSAVWSGATLTEESVCAELAELVSRFFELRVTKLEWETHRITLEWVGE